MRLKPSGLRCVDISGNFNAVLLCYFVRCLYTGISVRFAVLLCYFVRCLYRYFCAVLRFSYVILYGVYTGISVRFCGVRTLLTPPPSFKTFV